MAHRTPPPTELLALDDLQPDPRAANHGTARGQQALAHSLRTYGAGRSIVVDRQGRVIAGNKTLAEAQALGLPVTVIRTDGRAIVAVQRVDLDLTEDARARELALADNRVGELNLAWDEEVLRELARDGLLLRAYATRRRRGIGDSSAIGAFDYITPSGNSIHPNRPLKQLSSRVLHRERRDLNLRSGSSDVTKGARHEDTDTIEAF